MDTLTAFGLSPSRCWCATRSRTGARGLSCRSPLPARLARLTDSCRALRPFGLVEAIWSIVALRRWFGRR